MSKITIIGGAGHIGLPLGILFANKGYKVNLYDKDRNNINKINKLKMPFMEKGAEKLLKKNKKKIFATHSKECLKYSKIIIVCIGTPVTNSKPDKAFFFKMFKEVKKYLTPEKLLIIRSSIYPGTCKEIQKFLGKNYKNISYCPERVVQGQSITELPKLPQIVSGLSEKSIIESKKLFKKICKKTIVTSVEEAELIKLFSNAWRYINFSISNEFYKICDNLEIDFNLLRKNMIDGYERNKNIPKAGFAAGPCLYKDTAQLNAFLKNSFTLGKTAISINQNFPNFIYDKIKKKFKDKLKNKKIGILGASFKSDIDDIRDSLSIELYNFLKKRKLDVKISDKLANIKYLISAKKLVKDSDVIILGTPHSFYKNIKIPKNKYLVDTWGFFEK
tara:strand:- start:276 stop:1442 length:1167 start_codon:yes stop_codon:yes gene_type:complete